MSDAIDALGRAIHDSLGINKGRTEVGVLVRDLERRGYRIVPASTPQFHVQPAASDDQATDQLRTAVNRLHSRTKEGPGRV